MPKNFELEWEKRLLAEGRKKRRRPTLLSLSEMMTLAMLFHQLRYRQFRSFYFSYARRFLRAEFSGLPSYHRCLEPLPRCAIALNTLVDHLKGRCTGQAGVAFRWFTADEVYGNNRRLRIWLEQQQIWHVMALASHQYVWLPSMRQATVQQLVATANADD